MENSPLILAIDTSGRGCSVVLWRGGVVAQAQEEAPDSQSRVLVGMMESVLAQAGVRYEDCDAVACAIGPGGFTSIRVGLATARAVALAAGKPLIGVSTLEVMAHGAQMAGDVVAVIDAHRGQWYVQRFRSGEPFSAPLLAEENGVKALAHGAKRVNTPIDAAGVARLAHEKWMKGERDFPNSPLYIREPDAKLPEAANS